MKRFDEPSEEEILAQRSGADTGGEATSDDSLIVLDSPIQYKGGEYQEIRLSEPNVWKVLKAAQVVGARLTDQSMYDSQINLVAAVAGVPEGVIGELPEMEFNWAIEYVTGFEANARRGLTDPNVQRSLDLRPEKFISFNPPIEGKGGNSWGEMVLRPPRVTERRKFKGRVAPGTVESILQAEMGMVEDVSGWDYVAITRMPISKFAEAADYLTGFSMAGPATGKRFRSS